MRGNSWGWVVATYLFATASGCATLTESSKARATQAVESHLRDRVAFDPSVFLELPPSTAWNAAVNAARKEAALASADFNSRVMLTTWRYETKVEAGLATQLRRREFITLSGNDARSYGASVRTEAESRTRNQCRAPTTWSAGPPSSPTVGPKVAQTLEQLRAIPASEFIFPLRESELLPVVEDLAVRSYGLSPAEQGVAFPLAAGWRETTLLGGKDEATILVRSTFKVAPKVAADGTQLVLEPRVQWRAERGEDGTKWVEVTSPDVGSRVVADFFGRLSQRVRPVVLARPAEEPLAVSGDRAEEPELPLPPPNLYAAYTLKVLSVTAPLTTPQGGSWDPAMVALGTLVEFAPKAYRIAKVIAAPPAAALDIARELMSAAKGGRMEDRIAQQIGQMIGSYAAPDLALGVALPNGDRFVLNGADNSHVASWSTSFPLSLSGGGTISWALADRDLQNWDDMAQGTIDVARAAAACGPLCVDGTNGAVVCIELVRN
jgi:hypothetical protein